MLTPTAALVPLLIGDLIEMLGFGGEVVLALSVGFVAWYLVKGLKIGKLAGGIVNSGVKMLAFAIAFLAVGIALDWWDPAFSKLFADLWTAIGALFDWVPRLLTWLSEVVGFP
jgi:hypothetical protein